VHIHPLLAIIQKLQQSGRDEKKKQSALSNSRGQIDVDIPARKVGRIALGAFPSRFSSCVAPAA
jgi:hypothetical protein